MSLGRCPGLSWGVFCPSLSWAGQCSPSVHLAAWPGWSLFPSRGLSLPGLLRVRRGEETGLRVGGAALPTPSPCPQHAPGLGFYICLQPVLPAAQAPLCPERSVSNAARPLPSLQGVLPTGADGGSRSPVPGRFDWERLPGVLPAPPPPVRAAQKKRCD